MRKELINLANGCSRTEVFISPKNHHTFTKSNFSKNWFVECRFHSPDHKDQYPTGFQYRKKFSGQDLSVLKATAKVFKEEMEKMLDERKYNPITKIHMNDKILHPYMPFVAALRQARENLKRNWSHNHSMDVKRGIDKVDKIKDELGFMNLLISDIRTWHIKTILDKLEYTDSMFNRNRSYLQSCFKELTQYGCCEYNPIDNIVKRVEMINIREVITREELKIVHNYLKNKFYTFWRYGKIFFYSGARTTELFSVRKSDVDLENQEYKLLIKKGRQKTWVKKVIIPDAVPFWREILSECKNENDYLFGKGLVPGVKSIDPKQISKRWKRNVKDSEDIKDSKGKVIKITADFYTHKHLFLDILDEMSTTPIIPLNVVPVPESAAQRMASHTSPETTGIYTTGKTNRKNQDLKKLRIG